jgi:hypothetical protein
MDEKTVVPQRSQKSPGFAAFLSICLPFGVGALYNGQRNKALLHLLILFGLINAIVHGGSGLLFGLLIAAFYFYQIFDNVQSSKAINAAAAGQPATEAVEGATDITATGSIFWGIFLIVLGVLLTLANFEIILYRTLGDYWPLAVIVIGVKLVADSTAKPKKGN